MEEKYMVNDILENTKTQITTFSNCLINTENVELRQTLDGLRSSLQSFYFELFTLATSKGYYTTTTKAKPEEIARY